MSTSGIDKAQDLRGSCSLSPPVMNVSEYALKAQLIQNVKSLEAVTYFIIFYAILYAQYVLVYEDTGMLKLHGVIKKSVAPLSYKL